MDNCILIENNVIEEFNNIFQYLENESNTAWTIAIKNVLKKVAKKIDNDCLVATNKISDTDCGEWLFDFVIYKETEGSLYELILIAECEWHSNYTTEYYQDLKYDFEKLLVAKSEHKLFIFELESQEEAILIIDNLIGIIKKFKHTYPNERYLFATWIKTMQKFYFKIFIS